MPETALPLLNWHAGLAPGHDRRNGTLTIGGVSAADLAAAYGTPVLALDFDVLDASIAEIVQACAPQNIEIAYAGKALLLVGLARHLAERGLHLDVCSIGELATAERAGFPAERVSLHGCGKTDAELDAAIAGRVGRVIVDNLEELQRIGERGGTGIRAAIVLRVNTGVSAHTHDFVRTGGSETKFGISPDDLPSAAAIFARYRALRFSGLHSHIGSQIFQEAALVENVAILMELAARMKTAGLPCEYVIAGGGFGVRMNPAEPLELDLAQAVASIARAAQSVAESHGIAMPRLGIEPGRARIARAGTSVYRVMAVKRQFGRPFVVVDGGIADNPRPALYDAYHHPVLASRESARPAVETVLCGRSCENDKLAIADLPEDIRPGDLIAVCITGAYTYSMASNYNRFPRPAVSAVRAGTHTPIARRESVADVLRMDCDA